MQRLNFILQKFGKPTSCILRCSERWYVECLEEAQKSLNIPDFLGYYVGWGSVTTVPPEWLDDGQKLIVLKDVSNIELLVFNNQLAPHSALIFGNLLQIWTHLSGMM